MADELKREIVRLVKSKVKELDGSVIGQCTLKVLPDAEKLSMRVVLKTPVRLRFFMVGVSEKF